MDPEAEKQNEEIFKTMAGELLAEARVPATILSEVQSWFTTLEKTLKKVCTAKESERLRRSIGKSVILPLREVVLRQKDELLKTFQWSAPEKIEIIGSWGLNTAVLNLSSVDILVEIPKECFVKSDLLNHKYHIKKAAYLTILASRLASKGYLGLTFTCPNGLQTLPALCVPINGEIRAVIHVVPPKEFFDYQKRLLPSKNNLRYSHFYPDENCTEEESCARSTPIYNYSIAVDILRHAVNTSLQETFGSSKSIQDLTILLKIWLKQRFHEGDSSFNGFLISMVVHRLSETDSLYAGMSVFQMLRVVFNYLSNLTWDKEDTDASPQIKDWKKHCDVAFLDDSGLLNFTARASRLTLDRVRRESRQALRNLTCANFYSFHVTFMQPVQFVQSFDHVLQFTNTDQLKKIQNIPELKWKVLDHSGDTTPVTSQLLEDMVCRTLKNRIEMADVEMSVISGWKVNEEPWYENSVRRILLGWIIKPSEAHKQVEKCESKDESVVAEFKAFWAGKSELRRFRDGSISESVVFKKDKRRICREMLSQSLDNHLGVDVSKNLLSYLDIQFETIMEPYYEKLLETAEPKALKSVQRKRKYKPVTENIQVRIDEVTTTANNAFDKMGKLLRAVDLPLAITTVQGLSAVLRGTDPFPCPPRSYSFIDTIAKQDENIKKRTLLNDAMNSAKQAKQELLLPKVPEMNGPICVQVQLEHNNKWPDNIDAVNRLKCALLIKIGNSLTSRYNLTCHPCPYYLDVLLDGFLFRIWLLCGKEILLYKTIRDSDGLEKIKDTEDSQALEKEGVHLPKLTTTLHTFQLHHACYGRVVQLSKRWVASHLMLNYPTGMQARSDSCCGLSEEAVELLVAHIFLNHQPYLAPPHEAQVGFLRFLDLLATTDWLTVPIIVNFNEAMTSVEVQDIERSFHKNRSQYPSLVIATPYDKTGSIWTKGTLKIILNRLAALAQKSVTYLRVLLRTRVDKQEELHESIQKIYSSPKDHYDAVIWLKSHYNGRAYQKVHGMKNPVLKYKQYMCTQDETLPIIDFDSVRIYIQHLHKSFDHLAIFLNDTYGGDYIAVVWKPGAMESKDFNVSNSRSRMLDEYEKTLKVDVHAVVESMKILGGHLVDRIEVRKHW